MQRLLFFFFLMIRRPPRSTQSRSSAASDVYKRQAQTTISSTQARGGELERFSKNSQNNLKSETEGLERAQGNLKEAKTQLVLVDDQIAKRTEQVHDEMPEATRDSKAEQVSAVEGDQLMQKLLEEQVKSRRKLRLAEMDVSTRTVELKFLRTQQAALDKKQVATLTELHESKESVKALKLRLKTLVTSASDIKKIAEKEEQLRTPPSTVLAPPSLHSQLSWDKKADEAVAHAAAAAHAKMMVAGHGSPKTPKEQNNEEAPH
eukprot:TRINITY_DN18320_c0_g1_i2.p1 TRINITY_DN18320_c0_g1~~TRINITY_DN18320_c0_g1_i2.p1  ORF type:complete len:262 (+),score=105.30 TRINITY_DN18320_c0_g1_i2:66-851(+)